VDLARDGPPHPGHRPQMSSVDVLGDVLAHSDAGGLVAADLVAVHASPGPVDSVSLDGSGERLGGSGVVPKSQRPLAFIDPVEDGMRKTSVPTLPRADGGPKLRSLTVELPGIEPGSYGIPSRLLRAQFAMSLLGSLSHANKPR